MKKTLSFMLCLVLCISLFTACSKFETGNDIKDALLNTDFNSNLYFENMTFGKVMEDFASANPEKHEIIYKINEEIDGFDKFGEITDSFDTSANDYISCFVRWAFSDEEGAMEYEEILFSVDKKTKKVTPVAVSLGGKDWEALDGDKIIYTLYFTLSIFTNVK